MLFQRLADNGEYAKIRRVQLLRNKMQHFVSVLEQYTQIEVIQTSWTIFKQNLAH